MHESRQVDELLNFEDLIFRSRLPSSVEVGQCSRIGDDQMLRQLHQTKVSIFLQTMSYRMGWCRSLGGNCFVSRVSC